MSTYSFADVTATIVGPGGVVDIGYGNAVAEAGISISMAGSKNTMTPSVDGDGMNSLNASKSGTITVRLLQTSPTNKKLNNMYLVQQVGSAFWGQNILTIRNTASGDIITGRKVAFNKVPDISFAREGAVFEWVFDAIKIDTLLGEYA